MITPWTPRVAPSILDDEAEVRDMTWEQAQDYCNFVLLYPAVVPDGMTISRASMRPEAPPGRVEGADAAGRSPWTVTNTSAHRCELAGGGRRVRIKQFLYDWAPPAWDHPALWKSEVRGFPVGTHVGWLGRDYRALPAASLCVRRTMVEISVEEGACSDDELMALCRGLRPVSPDAASKIDATPFGLLMYAHRHPAETISVPVGYWAHQRKPADLACHVFGKDDAPAGLPGRAVAPPASEGLVLDTVLVLGDVASPQEIEYLYQDPTDAGRYARVLASPAGTPGGIPYPPAPDKQQPCKTRALDIGGVAVHHAWAQDDIGPHEAVWQRNGENIMLLTKPMVGTDMAWFEGVLRAMLA
jgi:hypothetical protein